MIFNKRAMAANTLVGIILLVLGFVIILLFWSSFDWESEGTKQTCHQSIIFRSSLPEFGGVTSDYIPLNCYTDKICVGKECFEFENAEKVSYFKPDSVSELEEFLAREILSCWTMTGEGKLSIFSKELIEMYGLNQVHPSCLICSRIAFDKDYLGKENIDLNKINLARYMDTQKIPGKEITYSVALQGESTVRLNLAEFDYTIGGEQYDLVPEEGILPTEGHELAILFSQISSPTQGAVWDNIGKTLFVGIAGGSFFTGPGTMARGIGLVAKQPVTWVFLAVFGIYTAYSVEQNLAFVSSYCGNLASSESVGRKGCSVVRTVTYNATDIANYCTIIESKV